MLKLLVVFSLLGAGFSTPVELRPGDRYINSNDKINLSFNNDSLSNIVRVNNSQELNSYILNFIEQSSNSQQNLTETDLKKVDLANYIQTRGIESSEKNSSFSETNIYSTAETRLEEISRRLSSYISEQSLNAPKSFDAVVDSTVSPTIEDLLEKSTEPTTFNGDETSENPMKDENQIVEVYINGVPTYMEESAPVSNYQDDESNLAEEQAQLTDDGEYTYPYFYSDGYPINSQLNDAFAYDEDLEEELNKELHDSEGSGSYNQPQVYPDTALTSLSTLLRKHLDDSASGGAIPNSQLLSSQLDSEQLISKYQAPFATDSDTLNIILTPNPKDKSSPNIAILPTSELPRISDNISSDIGVDIEAILNSLAGSAAKLRNQPMLVEENHTQLIKKPGLPTTVRVKETLSEIMGEDSDPVVNVISNREEENSFLDLDSLIREVTGEKEKLKFDSGKSSSSVGLENLKLNVTTKTNIVNIFSFNIYPSQAGNTYQVKEYSPQGTSVDTDAHVFIQNSDDPVSHIISDYHFNSQIKPEADIRPQRDQILGAVLLSQLEGGGSDKVIQALHKYPNMMAALMADKQHQRQKIKYPGAPLQSTFLSPSPASNSQPSASNLQPSASDQKPKPTLTPALEKLVDALEIDINTVEGVEELKVYLTLLEENPQYAAAIIEANDDKSTNFKSSIGPLGYAYRSEDSTSLESPSLKEAPNPGKELLATLSGSAGAALMAGAVASYPYWLPLLGGKRKKRFAYSYNGIGSPDIPRDWLAILTGSKYKTSEASKTKVYSFQNDKLPELIQQNVDTDVLLKPSQRIRIKIDQDKLKLTNSWQNGGVTEEKDSENSTKQFQQETKSTTSQQIKTSTSTTAEVSTAETTTQPTTISSTSESTTETKTTTIAPNQTSQPLSIKVSSFNNIFKKYLDQKAALHKDNSFYSKHFLNLLQNSKSNPKKETFLSSKKQTQTPTLTTTTTTAKTTSTTTEAAMKAAEATTAKMTTTAGTIIAARTTTAAETTTSETTITTTEAKKTTTTATPTITEATSTTPVSILTKPTAKAKATKTPLNRKQPVSGFMWFTTPSGESKFSYSSNVPLSVPSSTIEPSKMILDSSLISTDNDFSTDIDSSTMKSSISNVLREQIFENFYPEVNSMSSTINRPTSPANENIFKWQEEITANIEDLESEFWMHSPQYQSNSYYSKDESGLLPSWSYSEDIKLNVDKLMEDLIQPDNRETGQGRKKEDQMKNQIKGSNSNLFNPDTFAGFLVAVQQNTTGEQNFEYSSSVGEYDRKGTNHSEVNTEYYETTIVYSVPNENFQLTRPDQEKKTVKQEDNINANEIKVENRNEISFYVENEPESVPYNKNPEILLMKKNVTSSRDILNYLSSLMKSTNSLKNKYSGDNSVHRPARETTIRTVSNLDLLPLSSPKGDLLPVSGFRGETFPDSGSIPKLKIKTSGNLNSDLQKILLQIKGGEEWKINNENDYDHVWINGGNNQEILQDVEGPVQNLVNVPLELRGDEDSIWEAGLNPVFNNKQSSVERYPQIYQSFKPFHPVSLSPNTEKPVLTNSNGYLASLFSLINKSSFHQHNPDRENKTSPSNTTPLTPPNSSSDLTLISTTKDNNNMINDGLELTTTSDVFNMDSLGAETREEPVYLSVPEDNKFFKSKFELFEGENSSRNRVKSGSKNKFIMENYTPSIFNNFKTLTSRPLIKYHGDPNQTFSQLNPDLTASGRLKINSEKNYLYFPDTPTTTKTMTTSISTKTTTTATKTISITDRPYFPIKPFRPSFNIVKKGQVPIPPPRTVLSQAINTIAKPSLAQDEIVTSSTSPTEMETANPQQPQQFPSNKDVFKTQEQNTMEEIIKSLQHQQPPLFFSIQNSTGFKSTTPFLPPFIIQDPTTVTPTLLPLNLTVSLKNESITKSSISSESDLLKFIHNLVQEATQQQNNSRPLVNKAAETNNSSSLTQNILKIQNGQMISIADENKIFEQSTVNPKTEELHQMLKNVAQGLPFIFFPANTIKSKEVSAISTTAVPTNTISTTAVPTNTISTNAVPENTINTTAVPANTISTTAVPANTISTSLVYANTMRITAVPENAIKTTSVPVNTTESSTTTTTTETAFPKTTTVTITKSTFATTAQPTSVTESLKNNIEFKIQESTPLPILPFGTTLKTTTSTTTEATTPTPLDMSAGGIITRILSGAAAPLAGLSAATLAYTAAAMMPVWLPLALGRRKRDIMEEIQIPDSLKRSPNWDNIST